MVSYNIESLEEWGENTFDFSIDDYDWIKKFEFMSHKELEFKYKMENIYPLNLNQILLLK